VFVSGIGCSSRFPHYLRTYGFHGIHGRALPVATGLKLQRPDLTVFVVMGDGDCTSIGAAHWVHAIRYNMPMVALLLDNGIYGLTKKQTSPTTRHGTSTNTHPGGSKLPSLNPLTTTLGTTNVSFVAQTAEFVPSHLYATLRAAYAHHGFSFVRILQRCPIYLPGSYDAAIRDPQQVEMLVHDDGVLVPELAAIYTRRVAHDPSDLDAARRLADDTSAIRLGVFFRDERRPTYDRMVRPAPRTPRERHELLNAELDKYAV
jgi:2-oxoglutarate ferredoxin oxidoreductase subunit beta